MNTIDLKYQIEIMYDLALQVKADMSIEHPVRLVQSVKSIIGINPDNPSKKLLSFCETYVGGFSKSIKYKDSDDKSLSEVVTFSDLELSLKNKNFNESIKNVSQLLKVSDSKHILEFFVEFSLKYNMQSFYCIWSVYKMMLFLRGKDILQNIIFCIDLIIADDDSIYVENNSDQIYNLASFKYDKNSIEQMWIYYSVINETLVRSENITKYIYNNSVEKFSKQTQSQTPNVLKEQKMLGREWISSYLENIDCKLLDVKLVLILEACRASLKASSGKYDEIIWDRLNIYLNEYR